MMIIDRVQVDVDDLKDFAAYAAIPATEPLEAMYQTTNRLVNHPVYGFTASGDPLVLDDDSGRLVRAWENLRSGHKFIGLRRRSKPPLTGPFTPAPPGMVAVFTDGHTAPVVFYDVYGRAVLMGEDETRELYLAEEDEALVRVDGGPRPSAAEESPA